MDLYSGYHIVTIVNWTTVQFQFQVLDAPELADDYYLNLIDWSSKDIISVGLGNTVYSWSAATANVARIADLSDAGDHPTSVKWNGKVANII